MHTLLRHQRRYRPVALAERIENLGEFPLDAPVVALDSAPASLARRAARRVRARAAGSRSVWDHRLASAARAHGALALHAHFGPTGARAVGAAELLGAPLVTTFYGFDLAFARENPEWREPYARLFERGTLFVCEGPAMAGQLGAIGCPRGRIRIVRIGLDLEQFPHRPRERGEPLVAIATGRFVEKKGLDLAIRAFAAALPDLGDAELWLVGDGPQRAELERIAAETGAERRVRFLGMLAFADYRAAMARAHVGLQPSRTAADGDTEGGAPTVLLEMQAAGMPVVSTLHADIPAVVARPDELAPENDVDAIRAALVTVARDGEAGWRARIAEGRALVEREHDARVTAARAEAVYDEALGARA